MDPPQLRLLLRIAVGYQRFGLPHWAEYYYETGLKLLGKEQRQRKLASRDGCGRYGKVQINTQLLAAITMATARTATACSRSMLWGTTTVLNLVRAVKGPQRLQAIPPHLQNVGVRVAVSRA